MRSSRAHWSGLIVVEWSISSMRRIVGDST
jgi:hypothetical protein